MLEKLVVEWDIWISSKLTTNHNVLQVVEEASPMISFINEEVRKVCQPHDDTLMVTMRIANHNMHWILIKIESSVDVMLQATYDQIELLKISWGTLYDR